MVCELYLNKADKKRKGEEHLQRTENDSGMTM